MKNSFYFFISDSKINQLCEHTLYYFYASLKDGGR